MAIYTAVNTGSQIFWSVVGINQTMQAFNGYMTSSGGVVDLTLPASSSIGDIIRVTNVTGGFSIRQNAGQFINIGLDSTTVGTAGHIDSTAVGDSIEIVCIIAGPSAGWETLSTMGNLTFA